MPTEEVVIVAYWSFEDEKLHAHQVNSSSFAAVMEVKNPHRSSLNQPPDSSRNKSPLLQRGVEALPSRRERGIPA